MSDGPKSDGSFKWFMNDMMGLASLLTIVLLAGGLFMALAMYVDNHEKIKDMERPLGVERERERLEHFLDDRFEHFGPRW